MAIASPLPVHIDHETPTGGVAMHPANTAYPSGPRRLAFVSGIDGESPYIDVIDTFNFFRLHRIYTRDRVVGALVVAPRAPSDPADVNLRLYALTSSGVLGLGATVQTTTRKIAADDFFTGQGSPQVTGLNTFSVSGTFSTSGIGCSTKTSG